MLRKKSATTFAATVSSSQTFVHTFRDHLEQTLEDVVSHASELAHHCGRQRVQKHDVAQAMTNLCIMCESYHIGPSGHPVCKVLSTSKTIGGAIDYDGFCDGDISQCISGYGSCSIGGGGRTKRKQPRRRRQKQGGNVIPTYSGYCDKLSSQCTFGQDLVLEATECAASGGSKRRRKRSTSTRKQKRGGNPIPTYSGYCDSQASQCIFGQDLVSEATECAASGGSKRRRKRLHQNYKGGNYNGYCHGDPTQCEHDDVVADSAAVCAVSGGRRRKHSVRRGGDVIPKVSFVVKSVIKEFGKANYDVSWTEESLRLLERGIQFHVKQVLKETKEDNLFNQSKTMALKRVLDNIH